MPPSSATASVPACNPNISCTTWASVAQADNPFNYSGLTKTSTALPRLAVLVFVNPLYSAISKIYSDTRVI
ncbi:hypothetical protein EWP20_06430 [Neisseria meningitidis]|nr:hypothetical protein A6J51_13670 [Neisseria meningitidis]MBG8578718.1 hypothetical protein [Neisseria meningitidis]MBG8594151.1 hypothetical protein [Neisseria meningitidis]MBG8602890.1 hypothetical protein [Neisseria meningitidis]MBG8604689.1 hypothetical protein [Neisseria meningitidis]